MNEVLPLLAVPGMLAARAWRHRAPRQLRWDLHTAIQAQAPALLTDAGRAPLMSVARALALPPGEVDATFQAVVAAAAPGRSHAGGLSAVDATRAMLWPLGLELLELEAAGHRGAPGGRVRIHGHRRGRPVTVRLSDSGSDIHVEEPVAAFALAITDLVWSGVESVPSRLRDTIEGLAPAARWNGLVIAGDHDGVHLRRPPGAPYSWMHDLWLAELLADAAPRAVAAPA